ncbi:multiple inositol polyphosphate phosphatase 1-like [Actinia tenebrosa]|uniref:Multiple inositol polyphosphate phosphatase 1 n=1 Tax=Actinia tenebrosa TaxID=6105 RepID=A0A6P8HP52_ACTTE|nr:multiple inositol polyphosphate phosphatase 1-like [Actinia tenebrosa]
MLPISTKVLFLITVLVFHVANTEPELSYSSKTPYHPGDLNNVSEPSGCTAVQLNMVLRHGSRYPCTDYTLAIVDLLKKINQLHESKPYKYNNLTLPWNLSHEYDIAGNCEQSDAGNQEIYELAKRFKKKYPRLFVQKYWNKFYTFVTSGTPRTAKSASTFGYGLFEGKGTLGLNKYQPIGIIFSGLKDKDKVLRYYDTCSRYKREIKDGNGLEEWQKFGLSDPMKTVIKNIEGRLQLKGKIELSAESVQKLFWLCAFATMNQENRDWCSVFTKDDLEVLAYYDDINQYYRHSYGNEISYRTNCPLLADITHSLKAFVTQNQSYPYGIFRFTHIGTMTALQSILGMYNDSVQLKANNFAEQRDRTFRISRNVPMSANMAFVLYKCEKKPNHMVQLLINERPAVLPCCGNGSLCSFQTFLSCYEPISNNCDFDKMCQFPTPTVSASSPRDKHGTWVCLSLFMVLLLFL